MQRATREGFDADDYIEQGASFTREKRGKRIVDGGDVREEENIVGYLLEEVERVGEMGG